MSTEDETTLMLQVKASLSDFSAKMGEMNGILDQSKGKTEELGSSWKETAQGFVAGTVAIEAAKVAFEALKKITIEGVEEADKEIVMMVRLRTELGAGADAILEYAEAQQKKTRFTVDDILEAANSLTIHKLNREEIEKLLPVIQDFATKTGMSATETANAFGRAIEYGSTRGLRPFGIEIEKNGSQLEIFNSLIEAGNGKVKGLAEEAGKAGLGGLKIMNNELKETTKEFGEKLIPYIQQLVEKLAPLLNRLYSDALGGMEKWLTGIHSMISFGSKLLKGQSWDEAFASTSKEQQAHTGLGVSSGIPTDRGSSTENAPSRLGTTPITPGKKDDFWQKQHELILSNLSVFKSKQEEALQELNVALKNSETTIDKWYEDGVQKIIQTGEQEVKVYEEIKRTSKDANEVKKAENEIDKSVIETNKKLLDLFEKKTEALKKQAQEKAQLQSLLDKTSDEADVSNGVGNQDPIANLKSKFQKENTAIADQNAKKILEARKLHATDDQLAKLSADQQTAIAKKQAADEKAIHDAKVKIASEAAGNLADIFQGLYETTGSKSEAMFDMMKAAQIAQTIINTYSSATAAFQSLAGIPVVGTALGIAAAGAAIAAGLANVEKITQTKMVKKEYGGSIDGASHAFGGVNINAEGGEFVHRKAAVQLYGTKAMDALNRGMIPPSALHAYTRESSVPAAASGGSGNSSQAIHITNLNDPRMIDRHLATSEGKSSVVNFLGQNKMAIRKAIGV
jgi:hypothetical protein